MPALLLYLIMNLWYWHRGLQNLRKVRGREQTGYSSGKGCYDLTLLCLAWSHWGWVYGAAQAVTPEVQLLELVFAY